MKKYISIAGFVCILGLALLSGCATATRKDALPKTDAFLEPSSILKLSDVPVPSGFKLSSQDSYFFESGAVRVGILRYIGKSNSDQLVNFYKEQMAMYNWRLLNVIEYGDRLLNFERDNESCIINLSPKGKNVIITVSLGPRAQAAPKKSKEPVK